MARGAAGNKPVTGLREAVAVARACCAPSDRTALPADGVLGFLAGAPRFAVEVRSESDYGPAAERRLARKRADYFAAGTLVVWDVDLLGADVVRVYRAREPEGATVYRRGDEAEAEAEPAVPGWSMPVDDLFPDATTSRTAPRAARSRRRAGGRGAPARSRPRRR